MMDFSIDRWYSLSEITQYLGISRDTVLTWIAERNMPAHKNRSKSLDIMYLFGGWFVPFISFQHFKQNSAIIFTP